MALSLGCPGGTATIWPSCPLSMVLGLPGIAGQPLISGRALSFYGRSMDRLDAMSVLLAAVESGSLSKASRDLRLPLATVSRKVAELETHLKATLLIRSAKGLELTPAGRSYVTAAKSILEQ